MTDARAAGRGHNRDMSESLVLLPHGRAVLAPVRLGDRATAWLRGGALDRELVRGTAPETRIALTLHARRLIAPRMRRRLATTLQGMAARPWLAGPQVKPAREELIALAERLQAPGAVDARGVALVRLLLEAAGGPLHSSHGSLAETARRAAAALEPYSGVT
jgi:hypothetical protein